MMANKIDRPNTTPTVRAFVHLPFIFFVEIFKLFTTRLNFQRESSVFIVISRCASTRSDLEIRHLGLLARNRQGLSITFRAQLMAGNRKANFLDG